LILDGAAKGISSLKMILKTSLVFGFQTNKFDSHANPLIAGAYQGACRDPFRPDPKLRV
jgi:hypothetical protein